LAVKDAECVAFLQWALPTLGLRWPGYRKVRSQVCKRVARRLRALSLADIAAYRNHLTSHPDEWHTLDSLCAITISRFWRDAAVFERLTDTVLPALAREIELRGETTLRAWSIGCASGEEAYSVALAWHFGAGTAFPSVNLRVLGTDIEPAVLARARTACYGAGSLRHLPPSWCTRAFEPRTGAYCLHDAFRAGTEFRCEDFRKQLPTDRFDLILCRNLALTYFDDAGQRAALEGISRHLRPGGALVIGTHEALPPDARFHAWPGFHPIGIYRHLPIVSNGSATS